MDKKDSFILKELDNNSRQPYSLIAKKVNLSKDAVKYRINKLVESGVIKGFRTIINIGKLGYVPVRFLIKLKGVSPEKEQEIIEFFKSSKYSGWIVSVEGYWDINTYFYFKTTNQMAEFYNLFISKYRTFIDDKNFNIYENIICYSRSYLDDSQIRVKRDIASINKTSEIDELDKKILFLLSENSRINVVNIARETGTTSKTIIQRIRKLENDNIISGYRIHIDISKINFIYYKIHITLQNIEDNQYSLIKSYIVQNKNVIYWDELIGGYDIEFEMEIESQEKLRIFLEELRSNFSENIKDYEILYYYKQHYEKYYPSD